MFRCLLRQGSFPTCWRQANVTPIPKSPNSSSIVNYGPIFLTAVLFNAFERLVSVCPGRFMERSRVLITTQFPYRTGLGTCDALLTMSHTLQIVLESGHAARITQFVFSAAFNRVYHRLIQYMHWSVSIGGSVMSILTQFLPNRSQHFIVENCRSKLVKVVSLVPQLSVLAPLLLLLHSWELFSKLGLSLSVMPI